MSCLGRRVPVCAWFTQGSRVNHYLNALVHHVLSVAWVAFSLSLVATSGAETTRPFSWDMHALSASPGWTRFDYPRSQGVQAITFTGLKYQGRTNRVFAWLGIPAAAPGERLPAMVLVHGGGGTAFDDWVRLWVQRGYVAIAMDTCGQVPVGSYAKWIRDEQGGPPGWGGFDQIDRMPEDQWAYHAVADVILAHSLVRSLPEVDPERTGITGISWGGYLVSIAASVDTRFKLAVPVYGCGFYRETVFATDLEKLGADRGERWMRWWDPSGYLENTSVPFLWVNGSNDFAYTLAAWQKSYRLPKAPRWLCAPLRMPHAHGGAGENPREIHVFANAILKGGQGLARIKACGRDATQTWVEFHSPVQMRKAELNFTRDTGAWQQRKWESIPARLTEGRAEADLPDGARVWYFNLFDDRDCVVSSEHEELPPSDQSR